MRATGQDVLTHDYFWKEEILSRQTIKNVRYDPARACDVGQWGATLVYFDLNEEAWCAIEGGK